MNPKCALAKQRVPCPLEFAGATRPRPPLTANGDTFVLHPFEGGMLAAVIDGLGHGERAMQASATAARYIESHSDDELDVLFRGVAQVCRATDGVVMAAARFEFDKEIRFSFASIGNVETRLLGSRTEERLILRRGILGASAPEPCVTQHVWTAGNVLVLQSDGVSTRWKWEAFRDVQESSSAEIAHCMLRRLAKDEDDATVVVVREPIES